MHSEVKQMQIRMVRRGDDATTLPIHVNTGCILSGSETGFVWTTSGSSSSSDWKYDDLRVPGGIKCSRAVPSCWGLGELAASYVGTEPTGDVGLDPSPAASVSAQAIHG